MSGDRPITVSHLSVEAMGDIVHVSPSFLEKDRFGIAAYKWDIFAIPDLDHSNLSTVYFLW